MTCIRFRPSFLTCCSAWLVFALGPVADAEVTPAVRGEKGDDIVKAAAPERSSPKLESWYAATVAEDEDGGFLMVHFWSVGPLFRSEAVLAGRPITTIVDLTHYYIIDGASGVGVAIERSPDAMAQNGNAERPFGNELEQLIIRGGELIGRDKLGDREVDIYRLTDARGRRTIWASSEEPHVPLRMETFDRATSTSGKVSYTNWIYGPTISRQLFEPDPRVRLQRLTYDEYKVRVGRVAIGPAPVLYRHLLHGVH